MEKRYVVPEGMLTAALEETLKDADGVTRYKPTQGVMHMHRLSVQGLLEAALRWLAENPVVPTDEQVWGLTKLSSVQEASSHTPKFCQTLFSEWQRRMFAAPQPKLPEFMECDTCRAKPGSPALCRGCLHNRQVIEELSNKEK